jgi:signal transduction histidine kinase
MTVALIIIMVVHFIDYRQSKFLVDAFNSVEKSQQTLMQLSKLESSLKDIQRSYRGYVITHGKEFLGPYEAAQQNIPQQLLALRRDLAYDSYAQRLLDSIKRQTNYKIHLIENAITQIKTGRIDEAVAGVRLPNSLLDSTMALVIQIATKEEQRTEQYQLQVHDHVRMNFIMVFVGLTISTTLLIISVAVSFISQSRIDKVNRSVQQKTLEANIKLEKANSILQKANEELSSFSYSISHDLKAPLRAINGFSGILMEENYEKLDEDAQRALRVIQQNANRMDQLINDLLELARLGSKAIEKQQVNMQQMVATILANHQLAPTTTVKLHSLPDAFADASLIRQVWENLIGNAIKFSSRNEKPNMEIGFTPVDGGGYYWIKDNGAGFDPQYRDKLFKVFSRLHAKKEFEGTGAGLAIAKKIIDSHGGRIWADAELNKGATFYFSLPPGDKVKGTDGYRAANSFG